MRTFRRFELIVLVILVVDVVTPFRQLNADLYFWNRSISPPVSIGRALDLATEALGDSRSDYYCTSAQLFGNKHGAPRPGGWSFDFSTDDGRGSTVSVNMESIVHVDNYVLSNPRWSGAIEELGDVRDVFAAFLADQGLKGEITEGATVTMAVNTRTYKAHKMLPSGEWSDNIETVTGPKADGFIVRVYSDQKTRQPGFLLDAYPPYWRRSQNVFLSGDGEHSLVVEIESGVSIQQELFLQIQGMFSVSEE